MSSKLKRILLYTCFSIGIGLVVGMNSALSRRVEYEEEYRKVADPIVDYHMAKQQGLVDVEIPDSLRRSNSAVIKLWRLHLDKGISPDLARWLIFVGFMLVIVGGKAFDKTKGE